MKQETQPLSRKIKNMQTVTPGQGKTQRKYTRIVLALLKQQKKVLFISDRLFAALERELPAQYRLSNYVWDKKGYANLILPVFSDNIIISGVKHVSQGVS